MKKNKQGRENVKPNAFLWFIYVTVSKIFTKFKNGLKVDRTAFKKRNKKEGCIIIYNHSCKYDHFLTTASIGYNRTAYVISSHFYYNKILRYALNFVKAISKEQFKSDIGTIKKIKRALQNRLPVAIAPAGQITMHGEQLLIDKAIIKLLKMCNVDVYAIQIHGAYFAYPKWRKYSRKVRIRSNFVKLFSKEDLKTLTDDELYEKTCKTIDVNDRLEQPIYQYNLKSKGLAEGLETILYRCPKCCKKETLQTSENKLYCASCGNSATMNNKGYLEGIGNDYIVMNTEASWYNYQKNCLIREIKNNKLYIEGNFKLFRNIDAQYVIEEVGEGKVVLTTDELYYEGTVRGEKIRKNFKLESLVQLPFEPNHHFDIPDDEGYFEFKPVDGEAPSKVIQFVQAVETLYTYRRGL